MDTIDVTNLNRQFLFRKKDVGKSKAVVAAEYINDRCSHLRVNVIPHHCSLYDKCEDFFRQFHLVIAGLDNIPARRWINATLHSIVDRDKNGDVCPESIKVLLDGGTEGFKGQARLIAPSTTSCFDCSLDAFPPQVNYPLCTIAETPRLPEHCIEYAMIVMWPKQFPNKKMNCDSPEDMQWVYQQAQERAEGFGISGVTYLLTLGVVKRIIPAIASTNALVSSVLVSEAMKLITSAAPPLSTYFMYMGQSGIYTHTFNYEKKTDCFVCGGSEVVSISRDGHITLEIFIQSLCDQYHLRSPSITNGPAVLFMQNKSMRMLHEFKLGITLFELVEQNLLNLSEDLVVTDEQLPLTLPLSLTLF
eukprot:GHVR01140970.1.p1 GENE.GHVR01140970.1~~GHVR01140970.1.p1  ORF type:complete len:361 (-),score=63.08 GHVR01140970.1:23-1105(-)